MGGGQLSFPEVTDMATPNEDRLLILYNDQVVIGLLPQVGGRVVLLRRPDGANVLHSDPALWTADEHPVPSGDAEFTAYNGHITWLGPQSGWWTSQNLNTARRDGRAPWPPDPWLIYGEFEVEEQSAAHAVLRGPESPVSGVQLLKTVRLSDAGTITVTAEARNVREEAVCWDVWSNTRLAGSCRAYVPLHPDRALRLEHGSGRPLEHRMTPPRIVGRWFTFDAAPLPREVEGTSAKAFLNPDPGLIAGFTPTDVFLKRFELTPPDEVHPEQAAVEIYQALARDPAEGLLELEAHSPFRRIAPGEALALQETWNVLPWQGTDAPREHVEFLEDFLAR
jgi:hypothetical protein